MWLYLPKTTSVASPESADSILPSESLCRELAASAMWRQKFLQPRIWRRVLRKAFWTTLLFGRTCEPSMAQRGADWWMESLRASRVPITPSPESARESSASTASCGTHSAQSFATFDPNGSCWRTSQASLIPTSCGDGDGIVSDENGRGIAYLPDSGLFLETWPRSGSMRSGAVYPQPKWALPTSGKESSSWPTARAEDSECCGNGGAGRQWSSPIAHDGGKQSARSHQGANLTRDAEMWLTPAGMTGMDASGKPGAGGEFVADAQHSYGGGNLTSSPKHTGGIDLEGAAELWHTPQTHDLSGGNPNRIRRHGTKHGDANLADDVTAWVTPASRDWKGANSTLHVTEVGGGQEAHGPVKQSGRALFPPGPANRDAWGEILRERPELAPAVKPEVRGVATRIARGLDFGRADQLRSLGNLVQPLQGAYAITLLLKRLI